MALVWWRGYERQLYVAVLHGICFASFALQLILPEQGACNQCSDCIQCPSAVIFHMRLLPLFPPQYGLIEASE